MLGGDSSVLMKSLCDYHTKCCITLMFFSLYLKCRLVDAKKENYSKHKEICAPPSQCPITGLRVPVFYLRMDSVVFYSVWF